MNEGWIKLYRKMRNNPLWQEKRSFSKAEAWIDILMEARHSEEPIKVLIGSQLIECCRGQIIKSLDTFATRWGWSKSKVRRFLHLLQEMNQIRHENVTKTTRITVCNYDTYNDPRNEDEPKMNHKRNANETQVAPNKNVKKDKNVKNVKFKKPSASEIKEYSDSIGFKLDPDKFLDYYEANGWIVGKTKMKNWEATIRKWKSNSNTPTEASKKIDPSIEFDRILNQIVLDAQKSSDPIGFWKTAYDKYKDQPRLNGHHVVNVAKQRVGEMENR